MNGGSRGTRHRHTLLREGIVLLRNVQVSPICGLMITAWEYRSENGDKW